MTNLHGLTALSLLGLALVVGCSDSAPAPSSTETTTIETSGGTLEGARARVSFPPGALAEATELSLTSLANAHVSNPPSASEGSIIALMPFGMSFASPVEVTIPAPAGAMQVLRADDDMDSTWENVAGAVFHETEATFETNSSGLFVAIQSSPDPQGNAGTGGGTGGSGSATGGTATGGAGTGGAGTGGAGTGGMGTGGGTGGTCEAGLDAGPTCNSCLKQYCCAELAACLDEAPCSTYAQCRVSGSTHDYCQGVNELGAYPDAAAAAATFNSCFTSPDKPCSQNCSTG